MIDRTVSHYRILEKLGGGGMGVVYRAEDTRLGRTVALKFLPPELTGDRDAKLRFVQEAQAASALDHANICTVHDIDEASDGRLFICMAFYDGETLKRKIKRGPLPVEEVVAVAEQIAAGLKKAHAEGIVHCDIKPANVILTRDGSVKIVDFGLARLLAADEITRTDRIIGTLAYMSPEQTRGAGVDHRTDLWSCGVVIYEMLTGRLPFKGDNRLVVLNAINNQQPRPVTDFRRDVPPYLLEIIAKALAKEASERYRSAGELLEDLKISAAERPAAIQSRTTIAVLPFKDVSPGKDNEYFSDGLTEEILTDLSKIRSLRVVSRTSVMRLKGTDKSSPAIGRELGAKYLLEGSVRKVGRDLRITTQLIDAPSDATVWADKYSGTLQDVFDIQEQVSRAIVEALRLKLSPEEKERLETRAIDDLSAYECYLRARQGIMSFTVEGLETALTELNRAIEIVGENEQLIGGKGYVYWSLVNNGLREPEEYLPKVEECAEKIFQINPGSARCHMLIGAVNITKGRMQEAVLHLKIAVASDPNDPDALFWFSITSATVGKTTIAMEAANQLLAVDPLTAINHATPGFALLNEGRYDLALPFEKKWYDLEPDSPLAGFWYGWTLAHDGRVDEAYASFDRAAAAEPDNLWARFGLCFKHALQGERGEFEALAAQLAEASRWDFQYAWFMAECHALVGEIDQALHWLIIAAERGFINYPLVARLDPFLESIRREKAFESLLEKIKLEWEYFVI